MLSNVAWIPRSEVNSFKVVCSRSATTLIDAAIPSSSRRIFWLETSPSSAAFRRSSFERGSISCEQGGETAPDGEPRDRPPSATETVHLRFDRRKPGGPLAPLRPQPENMVSDERTGRSDYRVNASALHLLFTERLGCAQVFIGQRAHALPPLRWRRGLGSPLREESRAGCSLAGPTS